MDDPWPGPAWEPVIYEDAFPQIAQPGDIYLNAKWARKGPIYYLFTGRDWKIVPKEVLTEWVRGGLMKRPIRGQSPSQPSTSSSKPSQ